MKFYTIRGRINLYRVVSGKTDRVHKHFESFQVESKFAGEGGGDLVRLFIKVVLSIVKCSGK